MNAKNTKVPCGATIADYERPTFHWSARKLVNPGSKPCSRKAAGDLAGLPLCTVHLRMAREGFVDASGRVCPKPDIRNARNAPRLFPHGLCDWAHKLPRHRPLLGPSAPLKGEFVIKLEDGSEIWRLKAGDPRFEHSLGIVTRADVRNARAGKPVLLLAMHDQDHVEWAQLRSAGKGGAR
jgi:hypothetical protein